MYLTYISLVLVLDPSYNVLRSTTFSRVVQ